MNVSVQVSVIKVSQQSNFFLTNTAQTFDWLANINLSMIVDIYMKLKS